MRDIGESGVCYITEPIPPRYNYDFVKRTTSNHTFYDDNVATGTPPTSSDATGIALSKVVQSLQNERQNWLAGVSMGEARETSRMIVGAGRRLVHGMNSLRKGRVREAYKHLAGRYSAPHGYQNSVLRRLQKQADKKGILDDVSSAWMELNFGWLPLLSDVHAAASFAAHRRLKPDPLCRVTRKHKVEWTTKTYSAYPPPQEVPANAYRILKQKFHSDDVRYIFEVKPNFLRNYGTVDELGLTDPVSVAWNLLPLSFVVDWFVNVGQVLESLYEFNQWGYSRGLIARKRETLSIDTVDVNYGYSHPTKYGENPQYLRNTWYNRSIAGLPTAVPLRVQVDNPFDLKNGQLATLAVLARYAFR